MDIDFAEDWPGCPTDEQMLRQHAHLVAEENKLLVREISQYRKNVVQLVDMHTQVSTERDALRKELAEANARISDLLHGQCDTWKRIHSLKRSVGQREALLVQYNVPVHMWGKGKHP